MGFLSLWETIAGFLVSAPQRLPQCFRLFVSGLRVPYCPSVRLDVPNAFEKDGQRERERETERVPVHLYMLLNLDFAQDRRVGRV